MIRLSVFLLAFLILYPGSSLFSQSVKVIDKTTLQPVEDVYIYNNDRNKVASTDIEGRADIHEFFPGDTLNFQHPAFDRLSLSSVDLKNNGFLVKLAERPVIMSEIFVSASKRAQDASEIPQKIERISREQILFHNPQTSADLLQNSGKVFVQKSQLGGGSPMIRGFASNSV